MEEIIRFIIKQLDKPMSRVIAFLTIVSLLISIYTYYQNTKEHELKAELDFNQVVLPQELKNNVDLLRANRPSNKLDQEPNDGFDFLEEFEDVDSYWTLRLENTGRKELSNVSIELPFRGYYESASYEGEKGLMKFNGSISVGSLKQTRSINYRIWTVNYLNTQRTPFSYKNFDDIKITHANGAVKPSYRVKVPGFFAWVYLNFPTFLIYVFVLGAIIRILTLVLNPKKWELRRN